MERDPLVENTLEEGDKVDQDILTAPTEKKVMRMRTEDREEIARTSKVLNAGHYVMKKQ